MRAERLKKEIAGLFTIFTVDRKKNNFEDNVQCFIELDWKFILQYKYG